MENLKKKLPQESVKSRESYIQIKIMKKMEIILKISYKRCIYAWLKKKKK